MRKCIVSILALLLCLSLAACGEPESTNTKPTGSTPAGASKPTESAHIHTWTDATCVTPKTCIACGETEGEMVPHTYEESAKVDATHSQDGSVTYTCTGCGDSYKEILYATGSVGLEYEVNDDGTYTIVGLGTCTDSHVVIPRYYQGATVTAIGKRAFYDCHTIQEITIPKTVSSIGTQIFYKCSALHTVYYNGTYGSSENPFLNVANINKVVFGGEKVSEYICYGLQNINEIVILDCVTSIGNDAFSGCSSLTSVTIPDSVTSIGNHAFSGCSSLTSVTIPDSVTSIGDVAFHGCSSLTSVTIPDSVTSIGDAAFHGCSSLANVTIPDSVTSIGNHAFSGCSSLTSVTIPDSVTSIGDYAFENCISLTSVTIPDSVTSIGDSAFQNCISLTSITIPDSVTSIGYNTFFGCSSLTSIFIPDSVTSIGDYAFAECSSLTDFHFGGTKEQWISIDKSFNWFVRTSWIGNSIVHCTDGDTTPYA